MCVRREFKKKSQYCVGSGACALIYATGRYSRANAHERDERDTAQPSSASCSPLAHSDGRHKRAVRFFESVQGDVENISGFDPFYRFTEFSKIVELL